MGGVAHVEHLMGGVAQERNQVGHLMGGGTLEGRARS